MPLLCDPDKCDQTKAKYRRVDRCWFLLLTYARNNGVHCRSYFSDSNQEGANISTVDWKTLMMLIYQTAQCGATNEMQSKNKKCEIIVCIWHRQMNWILLWWLCWQQYNSHAQAHRRRTILFEFVSRLSKCRSILLSSLSLGLKLHAVNAVIGGCGWNCGCLKTVTKRFFFFLYPPGSAKERCSSNEAERWRKSYFLKVNKGEKNVELLPMTLMNFLLFLFYSCDCCW